MNTNEIPTPRGAYRPKTMNIDEISTPETDSHLDLYAFREKSVHQNWADFAHHRLSVIAADAATIRDEWLEAQPEGIRRVINNIRRHANLSENV